jgi:DNA replication protein DnaC
MNNGNADDLINKICAVGFLALDDWGANKETDWSNSVIEQIIDYRYSHEKPLIVTTNKDIESIPPAVLSRFRDTGSRIVFNGDVDRRVAR